MLPSIGVIEGIDKVGKTTLIDLLCELYPNVRRMRLMKPYEMTPIDLRMYINRQIEIWIEAGRYESMQEHPPIFIYDRLPYPCDQVYQGRFTVHDMESMDIAIKACGVKYIYIEPNSKEKYIARVAQAQDDVFKTHEIEEYLRITDGYRIWRAETQCSVMSLYLDNAPTIETARFVLDYIRCGIKLSFSETDIERMSSGRMTTPGAFLIG